ncbi:hypothetical protein [Marinovum sp.]|uniref:hypothetical protein n=1 Tax=Marinovum sp. TaxID=2024839 RepID=UPI002B2653BC|nr:hypothetical protein [Marinovum sp.]
MLPFINSIEPEAWVGLAGLMAGIGGAIAAVFRGVRKTPPQVGTGPPPTDLTEYVLSETRRANATLSLIDERMTEIDHRTEHMAADLRVLLDRKH